MARKRNDPQHFVQSPDVVRDKPVESLTLAERLHLLLELSERSHATHKLTRLGAPKDHRMATLIRGSRSAEPEIYRHLAMGPQNQCAQPTHRPNPSRGPSTGRRC